LTLRAPLTPSINHTLQYEVLYTNIGIENLDFHDGFDEISQAFISEPRDLIQCEEVLQEFKDVFMGSLGIID